MLRIFKSIFCADDAANSLKTSCLPQLQSTLLAVYLVGPQHFFLALWTLRVAAHSLDKEHHLGLSSKSVSCSDFAWVAQEMTLHVWGQSGSCHGHTPQYYCCISL